MVAGAARGGAAEASGAVVELAGDPAPAPAEVDMIPSEPDREVVKTVLDNGTRVLTERMPEARSVTVGFWIGVGGRDEPAEVAGASHFLEHLLFKGTDQRSARQIALAVDTAGGEMNAFTAREHTAYYLRVPASHSGFATQLLTEVLSAPAFRPAEIEAEREVILEELLLSEDTPEDVVYTILYEALFPGHPLGREVLGDAATIAAMTREHISSFFTHYYRPANLVVAAAGDLHHDEVLAGVAACFAGIDGGGAPTRQAPESTPIPLVVSRRPTEQAHVALGWRAFSHNDPDRYALAVCNQVLGAGMSSRLFQAVREERGLVYSVYSSYSSFDDSGTLTIYAGTAPGKVHEVLEVAEAELAAFVDSGITDEELTVARGYLEGSLVLSLEDSGGRMGRLAQGELARGDVVAIDEHLRRLRSVTIDDVRRVIARVFEGPRTLAAVGPFDESMFV